MRKLTSIRKIDLIVEHKNADRLEVAIIGGWPCVVEKGKFKANQLVVFCEVDTLLPPNKVYQYLEKGGHHVERDGTEWYRLKTMRLRGQLSQGIIFPVEDLEYFAPYSDSHMHPDPDDLGGADWRRLMKNLREFQCPVDGCEYAMDDWIGVCVNEYIGVRKYEKPLAPNLAGKAKGAFPYFIPRTDEERIQNLDIAKLSGRLFHQSEKLDGSSCTVYNFDGETGVCSRNLELVRNEDNTFWKAAIEGGVVEALETVMGSFAVQGEVCGPGIQGNKYNLPKHEFFAFNVYDIGLGQYMGKREFEVFCKAYGIQTVPLLGVHACPHTIEEVLADAEGCSYLNTETQREGVVWVSESGERVSFKAISNKFLLKNDE